MRWLSIMLMLTLLGGLYAQTDAFPRPEDAAGFHARAAALLGSVPYQLGDWQGVDMPVPPAAQKLLRPNAMLSRAYRNASNGRTVTLIVVQCLDSRDMQGHYPPNCYPAHGWERACPDEVLRCRVGGVELPVARYEFQQNAFDRTRHIVAYNFFVLPGTGPVADMASVRIAASNYRVRHFGAAQFQVVMDAREFGDDEADEQGVLAELIGPLVPLLAPLSEARANIGVEGGVMLKAGTR